MKSVFKLTILLFVAILIFFGCSMPGDPADSITIEDQQFALTLDRERFDFSGLNESIDLDSSSIGDDLAIGAVIDSSELRLGELRIDEINISENFEPGISFDAETPIPEASFSKDFYNIPEIYEGGQSPFKWAQVDTGHVFITVKNAPESVNFDTIKFIMTNNQDAVLLEEAIGVPIGQTKIIKVDMAGKLLTENMTMNTYFHIPNQPHAGPVELKVALDFTLGECSVDSALAIFADQRLVNDSLYTITMDNIIAQQIVAKDAEIMVKIKNESNFKLQVETQIDSLYSLKDEALVELDTIRIEPQGDNLDNPFVYNLDSCRVSIEQPDPLEPTLQGINFKSVTYCRSEGGGYDYVTFVKGQKARFYYILANTGQDHDQLNDFSAYMVKGRIENDTIEFDEDSEKFGDDDFEWDDYDGIQLESLNNAKLILETSADDLNIETLKLDSFLIKGVKYENGVRLVSEPYFITTDPEVLENLGGDGEKDTLLINGLKDVVNFHPDSIIYSLNPIITSEGTIRNSDHISMQLEIGVPFVATITDTIIVNEGEIQKIDPLVDSEDIDITVLSMYLKAFVNNPSVTARALLDINISDSYDEEGDSLTGDIKKLLSVFLANNPDDKPDGYMLHELEHPYTDAFYLDENGVLIPDSLFQMMFDSTTYIQQEIKLFPSLPGDTIMMNPQDFIDIQLMLKTHVKTTINIGDDDE